MSLVAASAAAVPLSLLVTLRCCSCRIPTGTVCHCRGHHHQKCVKNTPLRPLRPRMPMAMASLKAQATIRFHKRCHRRPQGEGKDGALALALAPAMAMVVTMAMAMALVPALADDKATAPLALAPTPAIPSAPMASMGASMALVLALTATTTLSFRRHN